jgi:threonine/homoserine/homoserine lactone efflux protein
LVADWLFLRSMAVGFGIAAPVGPVGVLCVRRTLFGGPVRGLISGLGAATADAVYGGIAAFGLSTIGEWLVDNQVWVRLIGGVFLLLLGGWSLHRGPRLSRYARDDPRPFWTFGSTFFLTLANPITLVSFAAIFAAVGVTAPDAGAGTALVLVAGVFTGSAIWWFGLSGLVLLLRRRVTVEWMGRIHYAAAALIMAFGIYALASVFLLLG